MIPGRHQSSGRWPLGLGLILVTVSLWGVLPIALLVVLQGLDVYTVTWFRFLSSFVMLFVFLLGRRRLPKLSQLQPLRLDLLGLAIIFLSINYLLFLQGLTMTSATNAEVIIQLAPVMASIGAMLLFRERFSTGQWLGLVAMGLGLALFFHEQIQVWFGASLPYLLGSGLLVLAALAWATYALAQKQLLVQLPSSGVMLLIYGGCTLLFTPLANPAALLNLSPLQWGLLLFCGLNTLLAYGAFAESLNHWEASRGNAVISLTPLITVGSVALAGRLWPGLIAPEPLTPILLMGAVGVVLGAAAIALGRRPRVPPAPPVPAPPLAQTLRNR